MAKGDYKKMVSGSQSSKTGFRIVKESPKATKINKATIDLAVEKALSASSSK